MLDKLGLSTPNTTSRMSFGSKSKADVRNNFGSLTVRPSSATPYTDATKCKKSKKHIVRPMNAFIVWSQIERRKIAQARPDIHNAEISKSLGMVWKTLSKDERQPYVEEANRLRILHSKEYPDYKYQPKKRSKHGQYNKSIKQTENSSNVVSKERLKTERSTKQCDIGKQKTIQPKLTAGSVDMQSKNLVGLMYENENIRISDNDIMARYVPVNLNYINYSTNKQPSFLGNETNTNCDLSQNGNAQGKIFLLSSCFSDELVTSTIETPFSEDSSRDVNDDVSMFKDDVTIDTSLLEQLPASEWKHMFEEFDVSAIDIDTDTCLSSATSSGVSLDSLDIDSASPEYFTPEVAEIIVTDWLDAGLGSMM